ncbi:hypothetical protein V6N13_134310 [Hibiscus sabdariffa]|uniref:Chitin-binding type-1 domain-containing protein n=1 Tax=Hibiscus sabdariffa TaxID=183260 RepID=A0ABR2R3T6_9ROSI
MRYCVVLVSSLFLSYVFLGTAFQCGHQAGGALCPQGICCSQWGWCGTTDLHCLVENGCQSNCIDGGSSPPPPPPPPPSPPPPSPSTPPSPDIDAGSLGEIISREMFDEMLKYRNDPRCHAVGFYTYEAFITAAKSYPAFASTGDLATRKREVAAFLGQTSHETTGGWATAPSGPYFWGYCYKQEIGCPPHYCQPSQIFPCFPGQSYCGRGPIQLSWNYNYGQFGQSIGRMDELLRNPDVLINNATLSFESAFWFWMTPQAPKPSCHAVMTGEWRPSNNDIAAGRLPGFGVTTNIINGGLECGRPGPDSRVESRIGFYKRYCDMLGVTYGSNLDCYNQRPFGWGLLVDSM